VKRSTTSSLARLFVLVIATAFASVASPAYADDPPPSAADLEKAKKAFIAGKKLHEGGKLEEAIEKYKESYKLSKKPALLYNIGLAMEEAAMDDLALIYFRKFLKEAPADAEQRPAVTERVKAIEKKLGVGTADPTKPDPTKPDVKAPPVKPEPKAPVVIKPSGTYSETDFQHVVVDNAPPGKPLDVTAFVPEDSGFTVTLFFRTAGEGKFSAKTMKWRYKELVARIPAPKMIGSAVQYYIDVKDQAGQPIAKSGKSTSPHQVLLEAGATARFYPDMTDDGDAKVTPKDVVKSDDDDDPLNRNKVKKDDSVVLQPTEPTTPGTGFMDVGSSKFTKAKWGTTIVGGGLIAFAALSYVQAHATELGVEPDRTQRRFHLHVPAGGIPKDGPSAGITMTTALVSLLTGRSVRSGVGMTGEVTLQGRVLPIGGVKQKVLAAQRAGLDTVILPKRNGPDLDDVPEAVRDVMTFHLVDDVRDVFVLALDDGEAHEARAA